MSQFVRQMLVSCLLESHEQKCLCHSLERPFEHFQSFWELSVQPENYKVNSNWQFLPTNAVWGNLFLCHTIGSYYLYIYSELLSVIFSPMLPFLLGWDGIRGIWHDNLDVSMALQTPSCSLGALQLTPLFFLQYWWTLEEWASFHTPNRDRKWYTVADFVLI